ncbi:MAG: hypothetical protein HY303_10085, partial [Candidatus Wallbacteria bacterium]|nr:hypothetical protein [Candidatus Wallbacteria bacterium]
MDAELPRVLTEEARRQILAAAPLPPASGDRVDVRVRDPQMRVFSGDLFHPATDRSGRYEDPRVPFSDATYKARVAVDVLVRDAAG